MTCKGHARGDAARSRPRAGSRDRRDGGTECTVTAARVRTTRGASAALSARASGWAAARASRRGVELEVAARGRAASSRRPGRCAVARVVPTRSSAGNRSGATLRRNVGLGRRNVPESLIEQSHRTDPFRARRAQRTRARARPSKRHAYASRRSGGGGSAGWSGGPGGGSFDRLARIGRPGRQRAASGLHRARRRGGTGGSTCSRSTRAALCGGAGADGLAARGPGRPTSLTPSRAGRGSTCAARAPSSRRPSTASDPCRSRAPAAAAPWRCRRRSTCSPDRG